MRLNMVDPPIEGKISKKRRNINMKPSKKKEILSFTCKIHWYGVLLPRKNTELLRYGIFETMNSALNEIPYTRTNQI
jgi:hypothetical protein